MEIYGRIRLWQQAANKNTYGFLFAFYLVMVSICATTSTYKCVHLNGLRITAPADATLANFCPYLFWLLVLVLPPPLVHCARLKSTRHFIGDQIFSRFGNFFLLFHKYFQSDIFEQFIANSQRIHSYYDCKHELWSRKFKQSKHDFMTHAKAMRPKMIFDIAMGMRWANRFWHCSEAMRC